ANSTSSSSGPLVLNAGVVTVPRPSTDTVLSTESTAGAEFGPVETRIAIALPLATTAPAAGFWLITAPAGTVALEAVVTAPTRSPAPVIAVDAALCVRPTTFGTVTGGGPDETTIANALPTTTWVPAIGFWLITEPVGTVELGAVVMEPTVRP